MKDILIYATGARGVSVIERLVADGHDICAVIMVGPVPGPPELLGLCESLSIPYRFPSDVNSLEFLGEWDERGQPSLGIVCGFPSILSERLAGLPRNGTINLHGGPVPEYRGGSPLNWQLIHGRSTVTISILRVTRGIDTGNILAEESFSIGSDDTIPDLHAKANTIFPELVSVLVSQFESGSVSEREQDETKACYWHQRHDSDGVIDWEKLAAPEVHNLVRGLTHPYPGAHSLVGSTRVRIWKTAVPEICVHGTPGRVCVVDGEGPYVVCSDKAIRLVAYTTEKIDLRLRNGDKFSLGGFTKGELGPPARGG